MLLKLSQSDTIKKCSSLCQQTQSTVRDYVINNKEIFVIFAAGLKPGPANFEVTNFEAYSANYTLKKVILRYSL